MRRSSIEPWAFNAMIYNGRLFTLHMALIRSSQLSIRWPAKASAWLRFRPSTVAALLKEIQAASARASRI